MNKLKNNQLVNVSGYSKVFRNNIEVLSSSVKWIVIEIPDNINLKISLRPIDYKTNTYKYDDPTEKVFWFSKHSIRAE